MGSAAAALGATVISFCGDWHWSADLFSHFRAQFVILLAITFPLLLRHRQWIVATIALAGIALNLSMMIAHRGPAVTRATPSAGQPILRGVSFNVLQGNLEFSQVARFLRNAAADIIVLQEVTPDWEPTLRSLQDVYPQQFIRGREDSKGAALIAKSSAANLRFEKMPDQKQIGAVAADLNFAGRHVTVFGIHSHKPTAAKGAASQQRYFHWLAERAAAVRAGGNAFLVAGDFNATPWCRNLRTFALESQLLDTSGGILFGATWSFFLPHRLTIDHAFVSPDFHLVSRRVGPALGSDHRPLILDLTPAR